MNGIANAPVYDARAVSVLFDMNADDIAETCGIPPDVQPGFITFFDHGWSMLLLQETVGRQHALFYPQHWYDNEAFAQTATTPGYCQLRMDAVPDSMGKTFAEQQALLSAKEEIPQARVVVMGIAIHFLATGQRLFPTCWVRCADVNSDGDRVSIGLFDSDGFNVSNCWDDLRGDDLGLASSRKF